jgi:hypothetical protein
VRARAGVGARSGGGGRGESSDRACATLRQREAVYSDIYTDTQTDTVVALNYTDTPTTRHSRNHGHGIHHHHQRRARAHNAARASPVGPHVAARLCMSSARSQLRYSTADNHQDPAAALALVSVRSDSTLQTSSSSAPADAASDDADLARAKHLVELHYSVKEAHRRGELTRGLFEARAAVERAVGG